MASLEGIDISSYQGTVNFAEVKAAGIEVVYIKATESTNYINPDLQAQYQGAKATGLNVGFYHFFHDDVDPVAQAQYFLNAISGMVYNCRLALDIEVNEGIAAAALSAAAQAFLDEVGALTGVSPILYTYTAFIAENLESILSVYPLWLADYGKTPGANPVWSSWVGWQYSQTGTIPGIAGNVDLDTFTGDILLVVIDAGSTTLYGKLINGSTWGPIATICKAKSISYTWDPAKQIMCINGASDASVTASGAQIVAGNQVIAGQLFGSSMWSPVAAVCNALGIPYTWDAATRTMKF